MGPLRPGGLLAVSVVLSAVALFGVSAGAGAASVRAVRAQIATAAAISDVSGVEARAGRAQALVAALGDPRTNPAHAPEMRDELAFVAEDLRRRAAGWSSRAADPGARRVAGVVSSSASPLQGSVLDFASAASRSSALEARLQPGQLLRGDIDALYSAIEEASDVVLARLRADQAAQAQRWQEEVKASVGALAVTTTVLCALVLGPVRSRLERRRQAMESSADRYRESLALVERVLDGMGTPVLVTDGAARKVTANRAARAAFPFLADRVTTTDTLAQTPGFVDARDGSPIALRDLPLFAALLTGAASGDLTFAAHDAAPFHPSANEIAIADTLIPSTATQRPSKVGSGPRRRYAARAHQLRSSDGDLLGAVSTFHDTTDLHDRHALLARHAEELAAYGDAVAAVLREDDARTAICAAACTASGAALVALLEDDHAGMLRCTAAVGIEPAAIALPVDGQSIAASVFRSGLCRTTTSAADEPDIDSATVQALSAKIGRRLVAGAWIPVMSRDMIRGVLVIAAGQEVDLDGRLHVLEALAREGAVAVERQDVIRNLAHDAVRDALTGAANRRAWDSHLLDAVHRASQHRTALSVIMLDLDHFKAYNDTQGHPEGDALLRSAVAAWTAALRPQDVLARYGGEEFAVLLPGCPLPQARRAADRLRTLVPNGQTASAGVAEWQHDEDAGQLLARADRALYGAKHAGRNRTFPEASAGVASAGQLESAQRRAPHPPTGPDEHRWEI